MIKGIYHIVDVENNNDICNAINLIRSIDNNIIINGYYWDGNDCGTAYVEFSFPENRFIFIYPRLDNVEYNKNINDYLDFTKEKTSLSLDEDKFLTHDRFISLVNQYKNKFTNDFITAELFYAKTERSNMVLPKAFQTLGKDTEILGVNLNMAHNELFVHVLFKIPFNNVNEAKMHDFGDFCLDNYGWLHDNHIYGQLRLNTLFCSNIKANWNKIRNKEPLQYNRRYYKSVSVKYDDYLSDLNIKENIVINNIEFNLDKFQ